jgi:hypothetical protein
MASIMIRHLNYLGLLVNSLGWALTFRAAVGVLPTEGEDRGLVDETGMFSAGMFFRFAPYMRNGAAFRMEQPKNWEFELCVMDALRP